MSQQSNKKKEEQGIDTSYGANTGTGTTPEISTPTSVPTAMPTVDTSYGANGTGTTPTGTPTPTGTVAPSGSAPAVDTSYGVNSGKVFSFSEWAKQEEERLAREKDLTYQRAEELRRQEYDTAAVARERAVTDARTSYAQNMAGYGAKAEQMGSMGLAGSGYGDYIDSQAYATQRAEVQYANAQEQAAQRQARYAEQEAKYGADVRYSQNMSALGKEQATYYESKMNEEQQDLYNSLVAQVQSGTLTKEQAVEQARTGGLSDAIIGMITATADSYAKTEGEKAENESYNATLANVNAGNYESADAVREAVAAAGITNANLVSQLVAAWTVHNAGVTDEKEAEAYNAALANVNAGNYASADAVREAAAAAGITNANLVSQLVAAWTVHNAGVTDEKEAEAFTTVYANIESGSYATREAAEQAARNAGITNENLISQIGAAWDTRNNARGDEYRANYTNLLDLARNGTWTAEDIAALAQKYGMDEPDIDTLKTTASTAYTAAQEKVQAETEGELAGALGDDIGVIESQIESGAVSQEAGEAAIAKIQQSNYSVFAEDISAGYADTGAIRTAANNGDISEEQYKKLRQQWRDSIDTSVAFFQENGSYIGKKAAKEALKKITNDPWCDNPMKQLLSDSFNAIYTPKTADISNSSGNNKEIAGTGGGPYKVSYQGEKYWVKSGGECNVNDPVYEIASEISDDTVFGWNNTVYIKRNDTIYKVISYGQGNGYNTIYSALFGSE